ncbi:MAG: aspartate kinase [Bacteroidetes bacterium]|nr:aspartate kinase [Bacteroidota bacterium]
MIVLKFGGTSVANAENISKTIAVVIAAMKEDKLMVVVSALGGTTDLLLGAGKSAAEGKTDYKEKLKLIEDRHFDTIKNLIPVTHQSSIIFEVKRRINELEDLCDGIFLIGEFSPKTSDKIASYGELLSSLIISQRLASMDVKHQWVDSRELIKTNSNYTFAAVDSKATNEQTKKYIAEHDAPLYLLPGFVASDANGNTTTLGRGGSDYTAAIYAAAVDAKKLEIWTDVSGMMTADPRLVPNARVIPNISYQEAMELSHFGAKVIYAPTIQPVMAKGIPLWIKNTFAPEDAGTEIERKAHETGNAVSGLSSIDKVSLLLLEGSGMIGIPGFSKRLFAALADQKINVILITQSSSEYSICVAINEINVEKAKKAVDEEFANEIALQKLEPLQIENKLSIVALVGDNMKSHQGISGKMFAAMGRNGVNIRAIAQGSSEKNISAVITSADVKKAINVLHEEFFETTYKQINLFIVGVGNVGSRLIAQLQQQQQFLQEHLGLQVRVVGLTNSRKMLLDENGIDLNTYKEKIESGVKMNLDELIGYISEKNLRNSIFIDNTANADVAACYDRLLQKSISVVACNKIACSGPYEQYQKLKSLAREFTTTFHFETNVGAGLPVIGTLNDLLRSGDEIESIEAVLSGTLNFVFNYYDGTRPFAEVVKQAQDEGYTEPDPRLDLGGTDVMRKILILARESGLKMEMSDITNNSFLPTSCMDGDVPNFYKELAKHEGHFRALYDEAFEKGQKLKFVAKLDKGQASVGLQHISKEHDFFHLYGKDNAVRFSTKRYAQQPLVIKGAGAGAEVTASGIFADIMRAARV